MILRQDIAPSVYCHQPAVVTHATDTLDDALRLLAKRRGPGTGHDEAVILFWSPREKRMITGSDVLRCLLSGMEEAAKGPARAM